MGRHLYPDEDRARYSMYVRCFVRNWLSAVFRITILPYRLTARLEILSITPTAAIDSLRDGWPRLSFVAAFPMDVEALYSYFLRTISNKGEVETWLKSSRKFRTDALAEH